MNKVNPTLQGKVMIYLDCLGALGRVRNLLPHRIPTRCCHSDILKTILTNCSDLTFDREFKHVKAHQDDKEAFHTLLRESQLNCACNYGAKKKVHDQTPGQLPKQLPFLLEPICMFVGKEKMTLDTAKIVRYEAH